MGDDPDDADVHRRLQRTGVKRTASAAAPELQPPVKKETRESDSDSDSYDNNTRVAVQRIERNRTARAAAATGTVRQQQQQQQQHQRPPQRSVMPQARAAETHATTASPAACARGSRAHVKGESAGAGVVPVLRVPDFLTTGDLSVDILRDIEAMYEPAYWDRTMTVENPALYVLDREEEERISLARQGAFENPLSFKVIAQMLQRHPTTQMDAATMGSELAYLATIEPISRAYEESLLRKPRPGEVACCNGLGCQCMKWFRFVMVEFLTPLEAAKVARGEPRSVVVGMCLLCRRKMATYMRCMAITTGATNSQNHIYQLHRNIVNRPGEYSYADSLPISPNSPYPIIQNVFDKYTHVKEPGGHEYLRQDGYARCTETDDTRPVFSSGTPRPRTSAGAAAPGPRPPQPARGQPRPL